MKFRLISLLILIAALLTSIYVPIACAESKNYYIVQVGVKVDNNLNIRTFVVSTTSTELSFKICNVKPGQHMKIFLDNVSRFGISELRVLTRTGQSVRPSSVKYFLKWVEFEVPEDGQCILVKLARTNLTLGNVEIVRGISEVVQVVNGNYTVTTERIPEFVVIDGKVGKLLYYDICYASVTPVTVEIKPSSFTMYYLREIRKIGGNLLLYIGCIRTFNKKFTISVRGAATINITSYYALPHSEVTSREYRYTIELAGSAKLCSNIMLCNDTYCGSKVRTTREVPVYLTVNSMVFARYYVDSALTGNIELLDLPLVSLRDLVFVDVDGRVLNMTQFRRYVKLVLVRNGKVVLDEHVCVPEGMYEVALMYGNLTLRLGHEEVSRGSIIKLPLKVYRLRVNYCGLCRQDTCTVNLVLDGTTLKLAGENVVLMPTSSERLKVYIQVKNMPSMRVQVPVSVREGEILVNACLAAVSLNVKDFLGLPLGERQVEFVGNGKYTCRLGETCLIPYGEYRLVVAGQDIGEIVVDRPNVKLDIKVNMLGMMSRELSILTIAVSAIMVLIFVVCRYSSGRRRKVREEEEEVIEIS